MNAKELILRIVRLNDALLHEQIEYQRVDQLLARLLSDRLLKNPPVISQHVGKYILLDGTKLPTGITRHIIPGRAMRINLPLDVLQADEPLEKKNQWLAEWMKVKLRDRHVRYYQEPVFLFDE